MSTHKHQIKPSHAPAPNTNARQKNASPFLRDILIEYGPLELLGRFFLKADAAARARGVELSFATLEEMAEVNHANRSSWGTLMPMFDPVTDLPPENVFCILGKNANGKVIATQAARLYDWGKTNLRKESESLRIFYGSQTPPQGAECEFTAPAGEFITGNIVYSGSGWYHPEYRRLSLSAILPRISRAMALARWDTQFTISFIEWILVEKGVAARYGYENTDEEVKLTGVLDSDFAGSVAWMPREHLLADLKAFLSDFDAQIDTGVKLRRGDKKLLAG